MPEAVVTSGKLSSYGEPLFSCSGEGQLIDAGGRAWDCKFEAGQLKDGECLLFCDIEDGTPTATLFNAEPSRFIGQAEDGQTVTAEDLFDVNYLPETPEGKAGIFFALRAGRLELTQDTGAQPQVAVFGLTNLILRSQSVEVRHPKGTFPLCSIRGQSERIVQTLKGVLVTAEIELPWAVDIESLKDIVEDISYLLSLAQGTKVQWVYRGDFDAEGRRIRRVGFTRITKPYTALCVIDYRRPELLAEFLAACLPIYISRKHAWSLQRGLIDAYLDAKSEGDYIEMRGVKLAVVVEMMKAAFIQATGQREYLIRSGEFGQIVRSLRKEIKPIVQTFIKNAQDRKLLYSHLGSLNRVPFRETLQDLCRHLSLDVGDDDLRAFVNSRDYLIHHARFAASAQGPSSRGSSSFEDPRQEYYWLVHFVDRLFLRLVGYNGPYLDWSAPEFPASRDQVTKAIDNRE